MKKNEFFYNNTLCEPCNSLNKTPFCFQMHRQPIMLISAAPSMQAAYKPLTSVRFFRNICLALFGDKYLREKDQSDRLLNEFCEGNIYWTHYHKCYIPVIESFGSLESTCAEKHLSSEMQKLKSSLKLIIVLGEEIHEKVLSLTPNDMKPLLVMKPFPSFENIMEFEDVRQQIGPYLKYIDKKHLGFAYKDGITRYYTKSSELQGSQVHLRFEFDAFERMLSDSDTELDGSIEDVWHKSLTVPNMKRCATLVQVYSFIENQIKVQIADYLVSTGNYTILSALKRANRTISLSSALETLDSNWIQPTLIEYVSELNSGYRAKAEQLTNQLQQIRLYRNAIVHNGGILSNRQTFIGSDEHIPGINSFAGTVFVSKEGEATLKKLAYDVTELLCAIQ